jgi:EAL domain-containing protein (putative c-di-GMP-specific phosphodiesterase class I)
VEQRSPQLFYHAVVLGHERRVAHYEVLTRIPNDDGELFSAATFMPMAHRVGLAVPYDRLVCDIVLKSLLFGPQHSPVLTINLSGDAIGDNNFRMWLLEHLAQNHLLAERLVFEIGEPVATRLNTVEHSFFEMLNRCGSALCVEHVGHPQYSANYLQSGLYRFVKFHRGLTRDIVGDSRAQEFVRGLAALVNSTGALALAECVETEEQWSCLLSLGVRGGQGYLFGKPTNKPVKLNAGISV